MDMATLAMWRDSALLLLTIEAMVIGLPILVMLYYAVRGISQLKAQVRPIFQMVRRRAGQVERGTTFVMRLLVSPLIWLLSVMAGLLRILRLMSRQRGAL